MANEEDRRWLEGSLAEAALDADIYLDHIVDTLEEAEDLPAALDELFSLLNEATDSDLSALRQGLTERWSLALEQKAAEKAKVTEDAKQRSIFAEAQKQAEQIAKDERAAKEALLAKYAYVEQAPRNAKEKKTKSEKRRAHAQQTKGSVEDKPTADSPAEQGNLKTGDRRRMQAESGLRRMCAGEYTSRQTRADRSDDR